MRLCCNCVCAWRGGGGVEDRPQYSWTSAHKGGARGIPKSTCSQVLVTYLWLTLHEVLLLSWLCGLIWSVRGAHAVFCQDCLTSIMSDFLTAV